MVCARVVAVSVGWLAAAAGLAAAGASGCAGAASPGTGSAASDARVEDAADGGPTGCDPEPTDGAEGACIAIASGPTIRAFTALDAEERCPGSPQPSCTPPFAIDLYADTDFEPGAPGSAERFHLEVGVGRYGDASLALGERTTNDLPAGAAVVSLTRQACDTTTPGGPGAPHSHCVDRWPRWQSTSGTLTCTVDGDRFSCRFVAATLHGEIDGDPGTVDVPASGWIHVKVAPP